MDWDDIKLFQKVAETLSYSKAAEYYGTSQPTVSRRMKHFQEDLGFTLFERAEHGISLSEKGLVLYQLASGMVDTAQSFEIACRSLFQQKQTIKIACSPLIGAALTPRLPELLAGMETITLSLLTSPDFVSLEKGDADIAIRNQLPQKGNLHAKSIGQNQFGIYAGLDFLEKYRAYIDKGELSRCPWVGYPKTRAHLPSSRWLSQNLGVTSADYQMDSSLLILEAVQQNMGLAVLPTYLERTHQIKAVQKPLEGLFFKSWLVTHEQSAHNPVFVKLKNRIEAELKEILSDKT